MSNEDHGPGIGPVVGIEMAEVENAARVQAGTQEELRQQLAQLQRQALFDQAFALAAEGLTQRILEELRAAYAGSGDARNLSKPSNVSAAPSYTSSAQASWCTS